MPNPVDKDRIGEGAAACAAADPLQVIFDRSAFGNLLRRLFQAQRRHIRFENEVVMPSGREALDKSDQVQMQNWILSSGHQRCLERSIVEIREARRCGGIYADCPVHMPTEES